MALRDNIANISRNVLLNQDQLEEDISYNGNVISAVVRFFEQLNDAIVDEPYNPGLATIYEFVVSDTDVPTPSYRDTIVYNGMTFEVQQYQRYIGTWAVQAATDERRFV